MAKASDEKLSTTDGVDYVTFTTSATGSSVRVVVSTGPATTPANLVRDHATTPDGTSFLVPTEGAAGVTYYKTKYGYIGFGPTGAQFDRIEIPLAPVS